MTEDTEPKLRSWERQILLAIASILIIILSAYGRAVMNRMDTVVESLQEDRQATAAYQLLMERRITILEQQQKLILYNITNPNGSMYDESDDNQRYANPPPKRR